MNTNICIPSSKVCDGIVDCGFRDDEANCKCRADQHSCKDGQHCLDQRHVCDGVEDCWDGDDEQDCPLSCPSNMIKCGNEFCLPASSRCNGIIDCHDGSDELDCTTVKTRTGAEEIVPQFCALQLGAVWCDGECILHHEVGRVF